MSVATETTPMCPTCEKEVFLVVKNGDLIEAKGRPGFYQVCCGCGVGGIDAQVNAEVFGLMRRAQPRQRVFLDTGRYANQYGTRLSDRAASMREANPYQWLEVVA